jgi:hypothetical protein
MRVTVRDEHRQFSRETHAYAEYRAFSSTIGSHVPVEDVTLTLARRAAAATRTDGGGVVCTIRIRTESGDVVEAEAVARHPHAAIDRVVALIRENPSQDGIADRVRRAPCGRQNA